MSTRKPLVGGNWKMNLHGVEAVALCEAIVGKLPSTEQVDVFICPPFPYLQQVADLLAGSKVMLGAQDFYPQPNGAFTGEVSLSMLADIGVRFVIVGHSERRHVIGETDSAINTKVAAALYAGFEVIVCVGEKIEQHQANQTDAINAAQTQYALAGLTDDEMSRVAIAYEPVWAIGTGQTATPSDAQAAHLAIRRTLGAQFGDQVASKTRIQYGGSVKPSNAQPLFAQPDIDGGLIGGASLVAKDFAAIVEAASTVV